MGSVQRVLQNLLAERVSIRDLPTILEGIAEACGFSRNISVVTEHVRARLARQISDSNANDQGVISLVSLSPQWEQSFAEALTGQGEDRHLSMPPIEASGIHQRRAHEFRAAGDAGRSTGAADEPGDPSLCPLDHRAFPRRSPW